LPYIKQSIKSENFGYNKDLNDKAEEEDANEEKKEESKWDEEDLFLNHDSEINSVKSANRNNLSPYISLLYKCVYINQILTPPKLKD